MTCINSPITSIRIELLERLPIPEEEDLRS